MKSKLFLLGWFLALVFRANGFTAPYLDVAWTLVTPLGNWAILKGPTMTFLVREGQSLGDYRVDLIEPGVVTLSFRGRRFRLPYHPK